MSAYGNFFHPERMANFYDSLDDRHIMARVYDGLLLLLVQTVNRLFGTNPDTVYHFLNFLTFQLGLFFFYRLNVRFFSRPAAIANTLILNFQPIFWGHSFINPKDIPIMVFFMGSFETGLQLVDAIPTIEKPARVTLEPDVPSTSFIPAIKEAIAIQKRSYSLSIFIGLVLFSFSIFHVYAPCLAKY
jgi:hypothetical protein